MQNILSNLTEIPGVSGYSLFDSQGACVDHRMPKPYELVLVSKVIEEIRGALDPMRYVDDGKIASLVARFESGTLIFRALARHTLLLLTEPSVNVAMLNVAFNVAAMKLERVVDTAASPASRNGTDVIPVVQDPPSGALSTSGSLNLTASPISQSAIPADAVGMGVMNELWKLMAPALGPAAKFVLKQQLKEMGLSAQVVGRGQYADLITLLAPKITNPEARNKFIVAARELVRR